jgi:hypothetical protein
MTTAKRAEGMAQILEQWPNKQLELHYKKKKQKQNHKHNISTDSESTKLQAKGR